MNKKAYKLMNDPEWISNINSLTFEELYDLLLTLDGIGIEKKTIILDELTKRIEKINA